MQPAWTARSPSNPAEDLKLFGVQWDFARSTARHSLMCGGWRSGKSVAGIGFIDRCLWTNPGLLGLIVLPTYKMAHEFIVSQFEPAFRNMITGKLVAQQEYYLFGNRRVIFLSADKPERIEQYTAAWAYADEAGLMKRAVYTRLAARVSDKRSKGLPLGMTGVPYVGWLKDEFEFKHDADKSIFHSRTADNKHLHPDYIPSLEIACPARMRKAYLEGQFVAMGGGVYAEYDPEVHIIPYQHNAMLPVVVSIDWSPRTPHVLVGQMLPQGSEIRDGKGNTHRIEAPGEQYAGMVIVDELVLDGAMTPISTERLCHEILRRGYPITEFVCDPAGLASEATSGRDQIHLACQVLGVPARYKTKPADRLIANGVDLVRRLLSPVSGPPRLYLSQEVAIRAKSLPAHLSARSIVNALPGYSYSEIKDGHGVDENPIKDGVTDHACDCLRYLATNYFPAARLTLRVHHAA